ncbi:MAG: hypothetical protein RBT11_01660 [Desulfobacterales bacterium]|jgi:hypothetical protein|nr:hypothetical protein [Desulfobacterales bacterium]
MWIEIFKGGKQTDSTGRDHDGDQLIDAAVASFDEKNLPPLVLGHPRDNSPAYGWVNGVKATVEGGVKRLLADIAPVEALREWVNGKLYANRSAAFYPDGRLRHVGFLGGRPPAVKGLAPLPAFGDGVETMILFENSKKAEKETGMKFSEFLNAINVFKKLGGKDEDIDLIAPAAKPADPAPGLFTEADITAAKKQAAEDEAKRVRAEFAEAEATRKRAEREEKIRQFCEAGVKAGKLAPAWVSAGLAMFMAQLPDEDPLQFCDGGEKKTPDAWFRAFIDGLPKLVDFSEIATRDKDAGAGAASQTLAALTAQKLKDKPDLGYAAAFSEAQRERPDLAAEYSRELAV